MFVYTFFIRLYHFIVSCAAPINEKAKLFSEGRKNLLLKISNELTSNSKNNIWIHCSSLGEFEQGRPLIEQLKKNYPQFSIVLTFFSPSGYEQRKNYELADFVFYLPADTKKNANEFIRLIQPKLVVFVKYEFWLNYLNQLHKNNIPTFLISALFREDQHFFKWYGSIFKRTLFYYQHLFVQNQVSLSILQQHDIKNCSIAGDTRLDRVIEIAKQPKKFPVIEEHIKNKKVIVAGSSWPKDEEFIVSTFDRLKNKHNDLLLIIAPHEINKTSIEHLSKRISETENKLTHQLFTKGIQPKPTDIIIIDTIGVLASVYQYADMAIIGGGFGSGIHNTTEALVYGMPVAFGPNYKKFKEAIEAIELNFGFCFTNENELFEFLNNFIQNPETLIQLKSKAKNYIHQNSGSTDKILKFLIEHNYLN